jgi:hypothetical protein
LGVPIEAVRQRAIRNKRARMLGTTNVRAYACPSRILRKPLSFGSSDQALVDALKRGLRWLAAVSRGRRPAPETER